MASHTTISTLSLQRRPAHTVAQAVDEPIDGPTVCRLTQRAAQHHGYIGAPAFLERDDLTVRDICVDLELEPIDACFERSLRTPQGAIGGGPIPQGSPRS